MGHDLRIRFDDHACYVANKAKIIEIIKGLPSYTDKAANRCEFWLKDPKSIDPWPYEVRLLLKDDKEIHVEVLGFSQVFQRDVRALVAATQTLCSAILIDDDGEPV